MSFSFLHGLSTHVTNSHVKKALRLPRRQHAPSQGLETSAACIFQTHESAQFFCCVFLGGGWVKGPEPCQRLSAANPPFQHSWGPVQQSFPKQALAAQFITSPLFPTQVRGDSGVL